MSLSQQSDKRTKALMSDSMAFSDYLTNPSHGLRLINNIQLSVGQRDAGRQVELGYGSGLPKASCADVSKWLAAKMR